MALSSSDKRVVVWTLRIVLVIWAVRYFLEGHWPLTIIAAAGVSPLIIGQQVQFVQEYTKRAGFSVVIASLLILLGPHGLLGIWFKPSPYELLVERIFS